MLIQLQVQFPQAVTGQKNAQEQLESLEELNLFMIPLDGQLDWYHTTVIAVEQFITPIFLKL